MDGLLSDPGFLVRSDPSRVVPLLEQAISPKAQLAAAVYRHSAYIHKEERTAAATRRHLLALDAASFGDLHLSARFTEVEVAGEPAAQWGVEWATGERVGLLSVLTRYDAGYVAALATTEFQGRKVLVVGQENYTENGVLRLQDLATGERVSEPAGGVPGGISSVTTTVVDGRPVAITDHDDAKARAWDLATGDQIEEFATDRPKDEFSTVMLDGRLVTVIGHDDNVTVWDPAAGEQVGPPLASEATALATGLVDGRPVAVTGHDVDQEPESGTVRICDLATRIQVGPDLTFPDRVMALAMTPGGELIVGFGPEIAVLTRRLLP